MSERVVLITGGAGFIGPNIADALLSTGQPVVLFDNLSRPGVEQNAEWLTARHGQQVWVQVGVQKFFHWLSLDPAAPDTVADRARAVA